MVVSSRSMNHPDFTLLFWKKTSTPTHTVETPANLSQKEGLWMVDASVTEGTTACFLNVKSDYFKTK